MLKRLRKRFKRDDKGQGMVEYGLILALVSVVAIGALSGIGGSVSEKYDEVVNAMRGPVITGESIYTEEEIDNLIINGHIPIVTSDDLDNLRKSEEQTFAKGSKWEGEYLSGLDKRYIQVSDIDMGSVVSFDPIGRVDEFSGSFNGGGHTIGNLNVAVNEGHAGLFGCANRARFANIELVDIVVSGSSNVGGLVGTVDNSSSIVNCKSSGKVTGFGNNIGGLVGNSSKESKIVKSYSSATVEGVGSVGGLVGHIVNPNIKENRFITTIKDCHATGAVKGANRVGGLVGTNSNNSEIWDSYAIGNVQGEEYIGGLVGINGTRCTVGNSHANGNVNGLGNGKNIGGLVGSNNNIAKVLYSYSTGRVDGISSVGGLVGHSYRSSRIENSFSSGEVNGRGYVGGLVGENVSSTVRNCYSKGKVVGANRTGGLIGYSVTMQGWEVSSIGESYSIGAVSGTGDNVGGLIGRNVSSSISNSYFDINSSNQEFSDGGVGKSSEVMKQEGLYDGWNFDRFWEIKEGQYPKLQWE